MHTKRMKCTMIMLGCLFTAFFLSACSNGRYTYELEGGEQTKVMQESGDGQGGADQSAKESLVQAEEPADATADRTEKAADTGKKIYVQINGAVKYPGVYKVQDDARIFDVVELAGGMTEDAEPEAVNQALPVEDGQMIRICTQEEWELARAIKRGRNGELTKELWIDRRENSKSLAWSSIRLAFSNAMKIKSADRPKALGDIRGVSYIYPMLWRFGVLEVPQTAQQRMNTEL